MAKKKSLGRGLGAILEEVEKAYENDLTQHSERIREIDIDSIEPNPFQPRKVFERDALLELSESIKEYGLIQPIIVYEDNGQYILIAGERRLRASKLAGMDTIKAIVADIETKKLRELALIENIQREDLNPVELAISYQELIEEYGITHEELSRKISKSRAQITNTLRLLALTGYTKEMLQSGKLSQGHAKVMVGLDEKTQQVVVDSIIGQKLSVREAEKLIKRLKEDKSENHARIVKSSRLDYSELDTFLGELKKLQINSKITKNRLVIEFTSQEDVEKLIKQISFH